MIDSNFPTEQFNPLSFAKVEEDRSLEEENAIVEETAVSEAEEELIPDLEEVNQYAENIIMAARAEAEKIISSLKRKH